MILESLRLARMLVLKVRLMLNCTGSSGFYVKESDLVLLMLILTYFKLSDS